MYIIYRIGSFLFPFWNQTVLSVISSQFPSSAFHSICLHIFCCIHQRNSFVVLFFIDFFFLKYWSYQSSIPFFRNYSFFSNFLQIILQILHSFLWKKSVCRKKRTKWNLMESIYICICNSHSNLRFMLTISEHRKFSLFCNCDTGTFPGV